MKERYARRRPYGEWLAENVVTLKTILAELPEAQRVPPSCAEPVAAHSNGNGNGNGHTTTEGVQASANRLRRWWCRKSCRVCGSNSHGHEGSAAGSCF